MVETSYIPGTTPAQQFEFYNYNSPELNSGEVGNDYFNASYLSLIAQYVSNFQGAGASSIANKELYAVPSGISAAWKLAWAAYFGGTAPWPNPLYLP